MWLALNREGIAVARCTVERLMAELGLTGAVRGKVKRTTIADPAAAAPGRSGAAPASPRRHPNRLWVADLTYVSTWSGLAYVAFVIDAYARRILGWRVGIDDDHPLVLDAIEQAIWTRQREGVLDLKDVVHHTDRGSQYTSIRFTERLAEAGIQPSVGAVGSSYDNALAETINGLYKTELIKPRKPVAHHRGRRVRHRRMGRLVQPPPPLRVLRRHPTRRTGDRLLRSTPETSRRLSSQIRKSPDSPGRFTGVSKGQHTRLG